MDNSRYVSASIDFFRIFIDGGLTELLALPVMPPQSMKQSAS